MNLPPEALAQLATIDKELKDGDLTQQGHEKKRSAIMEKYGTVRVSRDDLSHQLDGLLLKPGKPKLTKMNDTDFTPPSPIANTAAQFRITEVASSGRSSGSKKEALAAMSLRLRNGAPIELPPPIVPRKSTFQALEEDEDEDLASLQKLMVKQVTSARNFDDTIDIPSRNSHSGATTPMEVPLAAGGSSASLNNMANVKDPMAKFGTISRKLGGQLNNLKIGALRPKVNRSNKELNKDTYIAPAVPEQVVGRKLMASVKDSVLDDMTTYVSVASVLRARATQTPKQVAQLVLDRRGKELASVTYEKLCSRAEKCCQILQEKYGMKQGDKALLIFRKVEVIEFTIAMLGCNLAGVIAVPAVSVPYIDQLQDIQTMISMTGAQVVISTDSDLKQLNKELQARKGDWPTVKFCKVDDIGEYNIKKKNELPVKQPQPQDTCYFEYTRNLHGNLKGICMTNQSVVSQCLSFKALNQVQPKDVIMSTLEFRQQFGLVYGTLLSIYSGTQFISAMSTNDMPLNSWVSLIKKHHATFCITDTLFMTSITTEAGSLTPDFIKKLPKHESFNSLLSLRSIVIADPPPFSRVEFSLVKAIADNLAVFKLPKDCNITPVCIAAEVGGLLVAARTVEDKTTESQSIWLGMDKLSKNELEVTRSQPAGLAVNLVDCGMILPNFQVQVIDPVTNEQCSGVGEIWVQNHTFPTHFSSDAISTSHTFQAMFRDQQYCRTGVLGFLNNGRLYVVGNVGEVLQTVSFDDVKMQHFSADVNMFVKKTCSYIVESVSIPINLNDEELAMIVVEASKLPSKEELQKDILNLWTKLKSELNLVTYTIVVCMEGALPRGKDGNISIEHTRKRYDVGLLPISYVLIKSAEALRKLPVAIDPSTEDFQNSPDHMAKFFNQNNKHDIQICDGNALGSYGHGCGTVDVVAKLNLMDFESLSKLLIWRAKNNINMPALTAIDSKAKVIKSITFQKLSEKVARVSLFLEKKIKVNQTVLVLFNNSIDFVVAVQACLYSGIAMVVFNPDLLKQDPQYVNVMLDVLKAYQVDFILGHEETQELLKTKNVAAQLKGKQIPEIILTSKAPKVANKYMEDPQDKSLDVQFPLTMIAMTGEVSYAGLKLSHDTLLAQCAILKETSSMSKAPLFSYGDIYQGIKFVQSTLLGVFTGAPTLILTETAPYSWMEALSKNQVKDCAVDAQVLSDTLKQLSSDKDHRALALLDMKHTHNIQVIFKDRPDTNLISKFGKKFYKIGIEPDTLNMTMSSIVNPNVSCRSYLNADPVELYVKLRQLHRNKVEVGNKDDYDCIKVIDCGRILPASFVTVAQPGSIDVCPYGDVGEILVSSNANYDVTQLHNSLTGGKFIEHVDFDVEIPQIPDQQFARTGLIGFLYKTTLPNFHTQKPIEDYVLFVLGHLKDQICYDVIDNRRRVMLSYFAADLEASIEKSCPSIPKDGCIVFKTQVDQKHVFNVIAELVEPEITEMRSVPIIVNCLVDDHQLIPGNLTFVKSGSLPKGSNGQKLRWSTQQLYEQGKLQVVGHHLL